MNTLTQLPDDLICVTKLHESIVSMFEKRHTKLVSTAQHYLACPLTMYNVFIHEIQKSHKYTENTTYINSMIKFVNMFHLFYTKQCHVDESSSIQMKLVCIYYAHIKQLEYIQMSGIDLTYTGYIHSWLNVLYAAPIDVQNPYSPGTQDQLIYVINKTLQNAHLVVKEFDRKSEYGTLQVITANKIRTQLHKLKKDILEFETIYVSV